MAYEIKVDDGILCIAMTGELSGAELVEIAMVLARIETEAEVVPHRLVDLRMANGIRLDFNQMREVAAIRNATRLKNPIKSAVIAAEAVHYGFARMFQTLL